MEALLQRAADPIALAAELCTVICIAVGLVETLIRAAMLVVRRRMSQRQARREVWVGFAVWIVLALEFALAADIVRTAIAPTWDDIGRLAAIAVIRTALNYFLDKDLAEFNPEAGDEARGRDAP